MIIPPGCVPSAIINTTSNKHPHSLSVIFFSTLNRRPLSLLVSRSPPFAPSLVSSGEFVCCLRSFIPETQGVKPVTAEVVLFTACCSRPIHRELVLGLDIVSLTKIHFSHLSQCGTYNYCSPSPSRSLPSRQGRTQLGAFFRGWPCYQETQVLPPRHPRMLAVDGANR